jgi:hypothetical protein
MPPKRWAVILAGCAIAAVVIERTVALYAPGPDARAAAQASAPGCAQVPTRPVKPPLSAAVQPGGIDPRGASEALQRVLADCP